MSVFRQGRFPEVGGVAAIKLGATKAASSKHSDIRYPVSKNLFLAYGKCSGVSRMFKGEIITSVSLSNKLLDKHPDRLAHLSVRVITIPALCENQTKGLYSQTQSCERMAFNLMGF